MPWYSPADMSFSSRYGPNVYGPAASFCSSCKKNQLVKPSGMTEQQEEVWQCLEDFLQDCNEEGTSIESYGW